MERKTLGRLILTAVVAGALALAGCGGGDGVDQSVLDMVTAERDAATEAEMTAEAEARSCPDSSGCRPDCRRNGRD